MKKQIVILAAGKGTRMQSDLPKPLHNVTGQSMLENALTHAFKITNDVIVVYSNYIKQHIDELKKSNPLFKKCKWAMQDPPNGTGDAVLKALPLLATDAQVVVIYADHPFVDEKIIDAMFSQPNSQHKDNSMTLLASIQEETSRYGRIITSEDGLVKKIVEYKDASEQERKCKLCNSAMMLFASNILHQYLPEVKPSEKVNELYLTSMVEILVNNNKNVGYIIEDDSKYSIGVNTQEDLKKAKKILQNQSIIIGNKKLA